MAIDLQKELVCEFTAQERYDIISAAINDAYDSGFMNSYIFERALYCFAFAAFSEPDMTERVELFSTIHLNPLDYWTNHLEEINQMIQEHKETLNILAEDAETWFVDYVDYAYSMRGLLDNIGDIMNGVTKMAQDELVSMQNNGELQEVLNIANTWGINNGELSVTQESLFIEE